METVLQSLKAKAIISNEEIILLQQQLKKEYPDHTSMQRAQLFAKAIQERLDQTLQPFDHNLCQKLKFTLLRQTVYRRDFCINAYDIIESYTQLEDIPSQSIASLTQWINQYVNDKLTCEEVSFLLSLPLTESAAAIYAENLPSSLPTLDALPFQEETSIRQKPIIHVSLPLLLFLLLTLTAFSCTVGYTLYRLSSAKQYPEAFAQIKEPTIQCPISLELGICDNYLQEDLQYKEVNKEQLQAWLQSRHSLLADEPYFTAILEAAKEFNVNPLLLFAITGQEQSFVPLEHESAEKIAANPFNLYGSWKTFHPGIKKSARIAAQTVIHLGKGCPKGADQIKWINRSYASDPDWHTGVTYFFNTLTEVAQTDADF